jgi:peroxiredoxin
MQYVSISLRILIAFCALIAASSGQARNDSAERGAGDSAKEVVNFRLPDHEGRRHELYGYGDEAKAIVLFWTGNGCPIAQKSVPIIKGLRDAYAPKGVVFLMVNGDAYDTQESIAKEAADFAIDLPILIDKTQVVTRKYGVERTCEAVVIDPKTWRITYRGAVDDRFDYLGQRPQPTKTWVKDTLEAMLSGGEPPKEWGETKGCLITFEERKGEAPDGEGILLDGTARDTR